MARNLRLALVPDGFSGNSIRITSEHAKVERNIQRQARDLIAGRNVAGAVVQGSLKTADQIFHLLSHIQLKSWPYASLPACYIGGNACANNSGFRRCAMRSTHVAPPFRASRIQLKKGRETAPLK
jgi:hypothetical protein